MVEELTIGKLTESVGRVASCLESGGIVLVPTDTVYGLAVHPERQEAIGRLYAMKGRPPARNLPVMVSDAAEIDGLGGVLSDAARRLVMSDFVPGPVTMAVGVAPEKLAPWLAGRTEFAFRVPATPELRALLRATGPLLVTSANMHAEETRESVAEILASLAGEPDIVVDGGKRASVPSTLVNCRLDPPVVERVGLVGEAEIARVLGQGQAACP